MKFIKAQISKEGVRGAKRWQRLGKSKTETWIKDEKAFHSSHPHTRTHPYTHPHTPTHTHTEYAPYVRGSSLHMHIWVKGQIMHANRSKQSGQDIQTSVIWARTSGNPTLQCASKYAAVFKCISVSPTTTRSVSNGSRVSREVGPADTCFVTRAQSFAMRVES